MPTVINRITKKAMLYTFTPPDYQIEKHVTYILDNNRDTIDYDILSFSLDCMIAMPELQNEKISLYPHTFY